MNVSNALLGLTTSWLDDPQKLISHHLQVKSWWTPFNTKRAQMHNFVTNEPWDNDEVARFKRRRTKALRFHMLKSSERSMLGMFSRQKMNVKFSAVDNGPGDFQKSQILNELYSREYRNLSLRKEDNDLLKKAWAGGNSAALLWVEMQGGTPVIRHRVLSGFQFFFDPGSRIPGSREDASFVDVRWRLSPEQLLMTYPEHEECIREIAYSVSQGSSFGQSLDVKGSIYDDEGVLDGKLLVVERYYRRPAVVESWVDKDGNMKPVKDLPEPEVKELRENGMVVSQFREELWRAVAIASGGRVGRVFLENAMYHTQIQDPATYRMMFPVQELIDDHTEGVPEGHVEHLVDNIKTFNSLGSAMLHSAKNSASQAKLVDPSAFQGGETEAKRFAQEHTNPDATFRVRTGFLDQTVRPVPHSQVSNDIPAFMQLAKSMFEDASGTPPAFSGTENKTGISNQLNSARLNQATLQTETFTLNYRDFCKRRAIVMANYWQRFYKSDMILRVTGSDEIIEVNKAQWNEETQEVEVLNDLTTLSFDVGIDDGNDTFAVRMQKAEMGMQILESGAAQADQGLALAGFVMLVENSDMDPEFKKMAKDYSTLHMNLATQKAQLEFQKLQAEAQTAQLQAQMQQMQMQAQMGGGMSPQGQPPVQEAPAQEAQELPPQM